MGFHGISWDFMGFHGISHFSPFIPKLDISGPPRYHNAGEYAVLQIWGEVHEVLKAYGVSGEAQAKLLESWKTKKGAPHQRGNPPKKIYRN
jgi:6-phosphogluconate dehydrogenase